MSPTPSSEDLYWAASALRQFDDALSTGELDGAGRYFPSDLHELAARLDEAADARAALADRASRAVDGLFEDLPDGIHWTDRAPDSAEIFGEDPPFGPWSLWDDPEHWPFWAQVLFLGVPSCVLLWACYVVLAALL